MKFSEKLLTLRNERGLSQEELAEKAGLTRDGIASLETERRYPRYDVLQKLSKAFGLSLSQLMEDVDSEQLPPLPAEFRGATSSGNRAGLWQPCCFGPASFRSPF